MQQQKIASNRRSILFILFIGYTLANLDRFFINYAVLPMSEDLQLSASSTGLILSSFFLGYAIMQMPGGWLADRFGARYTLVGCIIAWSIFTGLTAVAWSLSVLVAIRFVFGLGEGGFIPASAKMINDSFPVKSRSRSMSILMTAAAFAGVVTPIVATSMMVSIGWRQMFLIFGAVGVVVGILFYKFLKPNLVPYEDDSASPTNESAVNEGAQNVSVRQLFRPPMMWSLLIASFAVYCINWGTASWLPTYLVQVRGLDLMSLGMLQMIPAASSIVFVLLAGYLVDKVFAGREKLLGMLCGAGLTLFVYLMFNAPNITLFVAYQSLLPIFTGTGIVLVTTLPMKKLPDAVGGSAVGMVQFGGQFAGFVAPLSIGFLVEAFSGSYTQVIYMLAGLGIVYVAAIATLTFRKGAIFQSGGDADTPKVDQPAPGSVPV